MNPPGRVPLSPGLAPLRILSSGGARGERPELSGAIPQDTYKDGSSDALTRLLRRVSFIY